MGDLDWEQLIVGHFKGFGSTVRRSTGVDVKLSPKNWRRVAQLGGNLETELKKQGTDHLELRTIFWDDQLVAYTYLKPTRDEAYGRAGFYNHTILVPIQWFIDGADIQAKVGLLFMRDLENPPPNPLPLISF